MENYFDQLEAIHKKPGLYIGSPSITNLFMFLNGYRFARTELGLPVSAEERLFKEFQPWLQEKFSMRSTHSWSQLVLFNSVDERDAFEQFFHLLHEFRQSKQQEQHVGIHDATLELA